MIDSEDVDVILVLRFLDIRRESDPGLKMRNTPAFDQGLKIWNISRHSDQGLGVWNISRQSDQGLGVWGISRRDLNRV